MTDVAALNSRIDSLVSRLDTLITAVQTQKRLVFWLTIGAIVSVVVLASSIIGVVVHQSHVTRHASCVNQNSTRSVVRGLLQSGLTAVEQAKQPPGLSGQALKNYDNQIIQAEQFYRNQIAVVAPLHC